MDERESRLIINAFRGKTVSLQNEAKGILIRNKKTSALDDISVALAIIVA